jgi:WD40 repeat protein
MNNLVLQGATRRELRLPNGGPSESTIESFCVDANESRLYGVTTDSIIVCWDAGCGGEVRRLVQLRTCVDCAHFISITLRIVISDCLLTCAQPLWSVLLPPGADSNGSSCCSVLSLAHLLEEDALFLARRNGELLLLHTTDRQLDDVGAIAGGLAAAAWSPDGEVLALVSANGLLLLMTRVRTSVCRPHQHMKRCSYVSPSMTCHSAQTQQCALPRSAVLCPHHTALSVACLSWCTACLSRCTACLPACLPACLVTPCPYTVGVGGTCRGAAAQAAARE